MEGEEKVPYVPSQTKRFEISKDPYSQERLKALKATIGELREKEPLVVGAVLRGSLSKGKTLTPQTEGKSDVDLVVFIDADRIDEEYQRLLEEDNEIFAESKEGKMQSVRNYVKTTAEDIFTKHLMPQSSFTDRLDFGFDTRPISLTEEHSMMETFDRLFEDQELETFNMDLESGADIDAFSYTNIAIPWLLDIGGGLKKYRQAFLSQLQQLEPTQRDLKWRTIINLVKLYERESQIPKQIQNQYPVTFDEAVRYYGVANKTE